MKEDYTYEDAWLERANALRKSVVDDTRSISLGVASSVIATCVEQMRVIHQNATAVIQHEKRRALWNEKGAMDGDEGHLERCSFQLTVDVDTLADAGEESVMIPANAFLPCCPREAFPDERVLLLVPAKSHLPVEPIEYVTGSKLNLKDSLFRILGASDEFPARCINGIYYRYSSHPWAFQNARAGCLAGCVVTGDAIYVTLSNGLKIRTEDLSSYLSKTVD